MIIYKNTFKDTRVLNIDFPIEDQYYASGNIAVVADGITRDPIGISDFSLVSPKELLDKYPNPSGAELAAKAIIESFHDFKGDLKQHLIYANKKVKTLNDANISECDYLQNDYYGAVASCAYIDNNILHWAYICDCGIIVFDSLGNIKFQTDDDKEKTSDPYINNTIGTTWNLPESRVIVRRDYRNNINNIQDGKCVSYGAITGEENAINFIKAGSLELQKDDIVIIYTDGFRSYLHEKDFIDQILNFNQNTFEIYIEEKRKMDYRKYGKERSLVIMK